MVSTKKKVHSSANLQLGISPDLAFVPLEKKLKTEPVNTKPKILLIAGPTGVGKSALSLLLAEWLHGEIVSVDSMQVYRGMNIGTAKVSEEIRAQIPHHLIDIRSVREPFNIIDFYYAARQACDSIVARNATPILVGGTGFYFRAFLYGPPMGPPSLLPLRREIEQRMMNEGASSLYEEVMKKDPIYAQSITARDKQKLVRALEIMTLTGGTVSELAWHRDGPLPQYDYRAWFLDRPRAQLYPLIDARCDTMLKQGLVEEVSQLETEGLRQNPSAAQAIGYRQCLAYLDSQRTEQDWERMRRDFQVASRQYAKRQWTWFRKEPSFRWINLSEMTLEAVAERIAKDYLAPT